MPAAVVQWGKEPPALGDHEGLKKLVGIPGIPCTLEGLLALPGDARMNGRKSFHLHLKHTSKLAHGLECQQSHYNTRPAILLVISPPFETYKQIGFWLGMPTIPLQHKTSKAARQFTSFEAYEQFGSWLGMQTIPLQ